MDMSLQTSLSSMAWGRRFLSASVVALLLISVLAFAIPLAPLAHAAAATPTITIDYPYFVVGQTGTRGIVVENPLGNPAITEIRIQVTTDVVDPTKSSQIAGSFPTGSGFSGVGAVAVEGIGPWVVKYPGSLSGGAAGKITLTIPAAAAEKMAGVVDAYTLTFVIVFETKDTVTVTKTIYEGVASSVSVTPSPSSIKAGETATIKVAVSPVDQGVPLQIWAEYDTKSVLIGSVVTGSDGTASLTYSPTKAASHTIKADVEKDVMGESTGAKITLGSSTLSVAAAAPTKVAVTIPSAYGGDPDKPINYITVQRVKGITFSLADTYGNPVAVDVSVEFSVLASLGSLSIGKGTTVPITSGAPSTAATINPPSTPSLSFVTGTYDWTTYGGTVYVKVTALNANGETTGSTEASIVTSGQTANSLQVSWSAVTGATKYRVYIGTATNAENLYWEVTDPTTTIIITSPATGAAGSVPTTNTATWVDLIPPTTYGSQTIITATITLPSSSAYAGSYSGSSRTLVTSTFATTITVTPSTATNVEAGKTIKITATLPAGYVQKGVPITFSLKDYSTGYAGTLSATTVTTDDTGKAEVVLTVDTKANAYTKVTATVAKPTTTDPTNKFSVDSALITTVAGAPAKLTVKTYEYVAGTPGLASLTAKSAVSTGGKLYVVVFLADAYNNPTSNNLGVSVQVSLSATAGALSSTIALINTGSSETWSSGYYVLFTAPTTYTDVTVTATTPQGFAAASTTVSVVALTPTLVITQPAADTTVDTATDTATVYIAGYAKVSPAEPTGTSITEIKCSLNGAANETKPIISVVEGKYNFNFSLTLEAGKIHIITVYAKDSQGLESAVTRKITVTKQMRPVFPAEIKTPTLVDTAGRTVTAPRVGTIVAISSPIVNKQNTPQQTLYIVQVKDSTGAIVSFNFVSGTIPANTELTFAIGWRPTAPGTYTIEVFAWNNFTEAQVLAPMQTITINVA